MESVYTRWGVPTFGRTIERSGVRENGRTAYKGKTGLFLRGSFLQIRINGFPDHRGHASQLSRHFLLNR